MIIQDSENLNSFAWYSALQGYSRHRRDDTPGSKASASEDLVSSMISTAIIPRLCKMIAGGAFDSYSAKHVRRIVDVTTQVQDSVGAENVKLQVSEAVHFNTLR
jgi:GC-rich sequence DNA-binding factor